ncbi:MAG: gfo/Idh/MocA family oxidoreductase [Acidimicrobiales bacterium]|nr:gfo/Idh/MocA family oxidoreductase [Acidimicrobiales bacterium]
MSGLRWGVLSTARINDALLGAGAADVVAVASRSGERAEAYAKARGLPRAFGSYEALLADPDIDAVYISLPNGMHVPWSIRALEAGKHVLCEKPLSRSADAVRAAFDAAQRAGRLLVEGFMWRHHPQVARAQQLLADGAVGRVSLLRARFSGPISPTDRAAVDPRLRRDLEGGALMDVGCYCVSGVRALAGAEPEAVHAMRIAGGEDVDEVLAGLLRFPGDVLASIDCGFILAEEDVLEAVGDAGILRLTDPWHARAPVIEIDRGGGDGVERIEVERVNHYALELQAFEAAVRGERPPLPDRADSEGQARTIEALYASAERGAVTPVPAAVTAPS